jgi:hypothetical protein
MNISDKKLIILGIVVLILMGAVGALREYRQYSAIDTSGGTDNDGYDGGVFCTMDAKLCPDGSYVGRTGPKCEFSACPNSTSTSATSSGTTGDTRLTGTLTGSVTLGPTCPVLRNPPDPQCADKPYQTTVIVTTNTGKEVGRQRTDINGNFVFSFLPGSYIVTAQGGTTLPRCESKAFTLSKGSSANVALSCDTGIR